MLVNAPGKPDCPGYDNLLTLLEAVRGRVFTRIGSQPSFKAQGTAIAID